LNIPVVVAFRLHSPPQAGFGIYTLIPKYFLRIPDNLFYDIVTYIIFRSRLSAIKPFFMPLFSTNIVIHAAGKQDLLLLYEALKSNHFLPERLPDGSPSENHASEPITLQYLKKGNLALLEVIELVKNAAAKTGKKFSFTVLKNRNE